MPDFILTTCGTSLLTYKADDAIRQLVGRCANATTDTIAAEDRTALERLGEARREALRIGFEPTAKMNAELNGFIRLHGGDFSAEAKRREIHLFLASDTFIGRLTRDLAMEWLRNQGFEQVSPLDVPGLRTSSLGEFRLGATELIESVDSILRAQRQAGHVCRFNLTGGFRSVNAFLQMLGALWADEVFFVFEGSRELIRIPRLPIRLDIEGAVREHLDLFRRLSIMGQVAAEDGRALPDGFCIEDDGQLGLSPWIEALFKALRPALYEECVRPPWTDQVAFGPKLEASFESLAPQRRRLLNERVDDLCRYALTSQALRRLDLKVLKGGPRQGSTHEADAWADGSAQRLFLHRDGGRWVIDRLDDALH